MKQLSEFTIKEFSQYQELLEEETPDQYAILELFGYDIDKMSIKELKRAQYEIQSQTLKPKGTSLTYKIGDMKFKANLNMTNITASQFIDLQTYVQNFKLQEVLSVFLIPMRRNWYGGWVAQKYNTDYNIFDIQDFLFNNFTIGSANDLSNSFFLQSQSLLKVMKDYLEKKEKKMKLKLLQTQLKEN